MVAHSAHGAASKMAVAHGDLMLNIAPWLSEKDQVIAAGGKVLPLHGRS